ncbi:hypothetical protein Tco_0179722, partial [Tanacetum coccineum]
MAEVEVPQTLEYRGGQLNAAPITELEINTSFINGLPKKWLSFCQSLRNTNHVKDSELASLFSKLKYEENLIDSIYETEKSKSFVSATPLSTTFISTSIVQDSQDSPNDEEDTRSNHEYLNDLEKGYQARALLAKSKRFFKKCTQSSLISITLSTKTSQFLSAQTELRSTKDFEAKYNKDEEEVSSDDNEMVDVKVLMALAEENDAISKEGIRNGEWVKISMRKVHTLLEMEDNDGDRKTYLDYLCIDLNYVKEQRNDLLSKHRDLVHELNACKEQILVLNKQNLIFLPCNMNHPELWLRITKALQLQKLTQLLL